MSFLPKVRIQIFEVTEIGWTFWDLKIRTSKYVWDLRSHEIEEWFVDFWRDSISFDLHVNGLKFEAKYGLIKSIVKIKIKIQTVLISKNIKINLKLWKAVKFFNWITFTVDHCLFEPFLSCLYYSSKSSLFYQRATILPYWPRSKIPLWFAG